MPKDAYYFSHDSNAKDDPKCMLLIEELQLEGYGIYWILIEVLREQENYKYPLKMIPVLARKFLTTKEKMMTVIEKYDLFKIENGEFFYSDSLNRRMGLMNDKREQARLAGKKSGEARRKKALEYKEKVNYSSTDDERPFNGCSTDDEQLKESKLKENKINEIKNEIKETDIHTKHLHLTLTIKEYEKLITIYHKYAVDEKIETIESYSKQYLKKYVSFYKILLSWIDDKYKIKVENKKIEKKEQLSF